MLKPADLLLAGVLDTPLTAVIGCLTIVPVTIWILACVSWMVMGDMDTLVGVPSILVAAFLAFVAMDPPSPEFSPLALVSSIGMVVVFPIVRRQMEKRDGVKLEVEQIERAYEMIAAQPDQGYSKFKLAEALYVRGLVVQARAIAESALRQMPKGLFPDEHRAVQRWAVPTGRYRATPCLKCGQVNDPDRVYCQSCGSDFLSVYARGKWLGSSLAVKLVAAWVAAVVSLVGIPYVLATPMTPLSSGTLVSVQLAVCGWLVWTAFFKREKRSP